MTQLPFTDRFRAALLAARDEAESLQHEYVGVEHLVLGMLTDEGSAATVALSRLGVSPADIRTIIHGVTKRGTSAAAAGAEKPYTSRAKKAIEFAMAEARDYGAASIGTHHLLLGILREEMSIGAQALGEAGVTFRQVAGVVSSGTACDDE